MQNTNQRLAVYGFIQNEENQILLVKRSLEDSSPGLWEMPGGTLEYGEQPHEGVRREVDEETNLKVDVIYPLTVLSGFSKRTPDLQVIRISFFCHVKDASTLKLSTEHSSYQWVDPKEITLSPISDLLRETLQKVGSYPFLINPVEK